MFFPGLRPRGRTGPDPDSELRFIDSMWGHFAMFAMTTRDREAIDTVIGDLLATKVRAWTCRDRRSGSVTGTGVVV
jgi:hypothetical protein